VECGAEICENNASYQCNTDIGNVFTVRGRLGYAFDHLLVYGTAGWARADVSLSAPQTNAKDEVDGYVVGGGAEMKIAHNVSLGAEALYFNFDDTVAPWVTTNCCGVPPGPNVGQQNFEADFTVVRGRLTLHLN
jgi:outer membrane immunogenic protein